MPPSNPGQSPAGTLLPFVSDRGEYRILPAYVAPIAGTNERRSRRVEYNPWGPALDARRTL
jgi:hypothetical protein